MAMSTPRFFCAKQTLKMWEEMLVVASRLCIHSEMCLLDAQNVTVMIRGSFPYAGTFGWMIEILGV